MARPRTAKPNTWEGATGDLWVRRQRQNDAFLEPFGAEALRTANIRPSETVIDVGCGCGASTLALAEAVGERGRVIAIDISKAMLDRARRRALQAGLESRIDFVLADATTHAFAPRCADVLYSRFGVMFFVDPAATFANLRRAMKPTGRLAFVCWQSDNENGWRIVPYRAALTVLPAPPPRAPEAPGGTSFASPARMHRVLSAAGWRRIHAEPYRREVTLGRTLDEAAAEATESTMFGDLISAAAPALRRRALAAVRAALEPHCGPRGVVLGAAAWLVSAKAS